MRTAAGSVFALTAFALLVMSVGSRAVVVARWSRPLPPRMTSGDGTRLVLVLTAETAASGRPRSHRRSLARRATGTSPLGGRNRRHDTDTGDRPHWSRGDR